MTCVLSGALALVNAEDRQLADEGVGGDLEHVGQQRLVGIVAILEGPFFLRLACRRE